MRTYRFYVSANPSANMANITIVRNGRIKSVRWSVASEAVADGDTLSLELSTQPASQLATHDVLGVVDGFIFLMSVATAVGIVAPNFHWQSFVDFPIAAGERLYLHGAGTALVNKMYVHVDVEER